MSAAVAIRLGDDRDRPFVLDLGRRTAMDSVSAGRSPIRAMVQLSYERLVDYICSQSHLVLIAEESPGQPRGFLLLLDTLPDEVTLMPQGFVAYMAVEPDARRAGIGRALLERAESEARERKLPHIAMMVTEDNQPARSLYESAGYHTERRLLCKNL